MAFRVLGVAGSLRSGSYNRALLAAAVELAPRELEIRPFERLREIPPYDADLDAAGAPEPVRALKAGMRESDGILIVTPEYNHGVPGVLKNAIDWASRPAGSAAFADKPIGVMGATPGTGGTIRAQVALRLSLASDACLMGKPEVLVARAGEKFDASGRLTDEASRRHLERFLLAFAAWIGRFATPSP